MALAAPVVTDARYDERSDRPIRGHGRSFRDEGDAVHAIGHERVGTAPPPAAFTIEVRSYP